MKKFPIIAGLIGAGLIVVIILVTSFPIEKPLGYVDKIINAISNNGETTVNEIFDFDFDRAYVFQRDKGTGPLSHNNNYGKIHMVKRNVKESQEKE